MTSILYAFYGISNNKFNIVELISLHLTRYIRFASSIWDKIQFIVSLALARSHDYSSANELGYKKTTTKHYEANSYVYFLGMFYNCQLDHVHKRMKHIPRTYKSIKVTHREYMLKTQLWFPFPAWSIHVIRDFVGAVYTALTVGIQIYFSCSLMDVTTCWSEIDKSKGIANYSKHHEIWCTVLHI